MLLLLALLLVSSSARAGAICRDGWVSSSTGSGTCSHHDGVSVWTTDYSPPATWNRSVYSSRTSGWATPSIAAPPPDSVLTSVYSRVGRAESFAVGTGPEPLDVDYIRAKLKGFPSAGTVAVVVTEGDSCVVGVYERSGTGTKFYLGILNMYQCSAALDPGDVVEILGDQLLFAPTTNTKISSIKAATTATMLDVSLTSPVTPVSFTWVEDRLKGFPKAGKILVVVSAGHSCVVGLFGGTGGTGGAATYALAELNMYDCSATLKAGQVVELLGDQLLISPTQNQKINSITVVTPPTMLRGAPAWATH